MLLNLPVTLLMNSGFSRMRFIVIGLGGVSLFLGVGCGGGETGKPVVVKEYAGPVWFENSVVESGVTFVHDTGHIEKHLMPESVSGGGALFDMDGDGDLDLYLVQSGSAADPSSNTAGNELYENLGEGIFQNVTAASGTGDRGYGMGTACGDYDGDGDVDLYVTNLGRNVLYRNEGGGRFLEVTAEAGVGHEGWGSSAGFFDYDRDGDLDLYVANYVNWSPSTEQDCYNAFGAPDFCSPKNYNAPAMDVLYRNEGDGTFTDVTKEAGISKSFGNGLGVGCADFNGDGWVDVFVADDQTPDILWINQGDGTFRDEAVFAGCAVDQAGVAKAGMGVAIEDFDFDGDFDLLVCNLRNETDSLYVNEGDHFVDGTMRGGLGTMSRQFTRFGVGMVDFDNDGLLDLYEVNGRVMRMTKVWAENPYAEPNLLYRGTSTGGFAEVKPRGGTAELFCESSRAALFGDLDNDGGVDVVVVNADGPVHVLMNRAPERGHWVMMRVVNRNGGDAVGAVVSMRVGDRAVMRQISTATSYLASNDPRIHVGLGALDKVEEVEVRWPDGERESFGELMADQIHNLTRGTGREVN